MFKRLLYYAMKDKKVIFLVFLSVVSIAIIDLILPLFSKQVISEYIPNKDINAIVVMLVIFIILIVLYAIFNFIQGYFGHIWGLSIHQAMRQDALSKIQKLPFSYFDANKSGIIQTRIGPDLVTISEMVHHFSEDMISVVLLTVVGYIYLGMIHFTLTTIIFIVIVTQIVVGLYVRKYMEKGFAASREYTSEVYSLLDTNISGVRLARSFANEAWEMSRYVQTAQRQKEGIKGAYRGLGLFMATSTFFTMTMNVTVIGLSGLAVIQGGMSFGDLIAFVVYFNLLLAPVRTIIRSFEMLQEGIVGLRRFSTLMDEPLLIENKKDAVIAQKLDGDILFDQVVFHYNKENEAVLKQLSLHIDKGTMVALVGPSGVGKSTIAQLIPRFYEIDKGNLYIDGIDVRDYELNSLRRNIGFVQQEVIIFWGSIRENIQYGDLKASEDAVIEAAKQAGIHDFIMSLPDGYNTEVGERGVKLSGGQKQRISLARIFLKNPSILILDEATSALDNITEAIIQENIEKLTKDRTVLVVAHRLSTIKNADTIVVLGENGVEECGTHDELLSENGAYSKLYTSQFSTNKG